jgi:hypothetical protein
VNQADIIALGTWPEWLEAVGTTAAFLIAAISYFRNSKVRNEAQARLVYSKLGRWELLDAGEKPEYHEETQTVWSAITTIKGETVAATPLILASLLVYNGSKELIGPVRFRIVNRETGEYFSDIPADLDNVAPESQASVSFTFANPSHPVPPWIGTEILFRDSSSQWWSRLLSEPIKHQSARRSRFVIR